MKVYTLMDNESCLSDYEYEHGLSLYIETKHHKILFDFGQTDHFINNAIKLGIDLSEVDIAVLSHGHYDHGGGLERFMFLNKKAKIYMSHCAFRHYYHGKEKYIGLDMRLKNHERFVYVENDIVIDDELEIKTSHHRQIRYSTYSAGLYVRVGENYDDDLFDHEIYLMIHDDKKVVFSGCAHKGILNIMNWFSPNVMIGGFHLKKQEIINHHNDILDKIAKELLKYKTTYYTGHCTGLKQYEYLKEMMNEQLFYLLSGTIVEM